MRRALALAAGGWVQVAPNPMVGAVVVREGRVVGEGFHTAYGAPHAEVEALRAAGGAARGAVLYVTLEPCMHHGKTPPCTDAIVAAGVRRVVFAAADPSADAGGGGARLRHAGVEVEGGLEERAALDLNAAFFFGIAGATRPWIALKLALTLDARVADAERRSAWITGEVARHEVHRLRASFDAVAVGIGTALADDPLLTVRGAVQPRTPPSRVVFDRQLRLPPAGRLARSVDQGPVIVVASPGAPAVRRRALEATGVRVLFAEGLEAGLGALREVGIVSLLFEGGAEIAGSLLAAGVVDRLHLFIAPLFLGAGGADPFAALPASSIGAAHRWCRLGAESFGADTLITLSRE
ncbi:MAG: bifunctional diaminohydroxyphosphoribosylaminopyrimidine deaminase/5-amino-6-(5-phosphoribosylamino)uracil reductase RibD [Gemmatimonadota bacterium]|nr:bifunctional diaminohydroxyphosphoribosylaminopyrimidine deaminase/5-amino-6-(5-phosphoribosylamino)uracil reductase RibD [Gemmatimonadota bacterium]